MATRTFLALALVVLLACNSHCRADVPDTADETCQYLTPDTFESFVAANKVALFQVHNGAEILAAEIPEAIKRLSKPIGYATLDASSAANSELVARLDRTVGAEVEFFVFRNGLPHDKLKRLYAGLSVDTVEEVLLFVTLEESPVEQSKRQQNELQDAFPLWSIHHGRDQFKEILSEEAFDNTLGNTAETDINVVQFFSRFCKYCQQFSYEWHKVSQDLGIMSGINFFRVDGNAIENEALLQRYDIAGFPSVKIFLGAKYENTYRGERKADPIKDSLVQLLEQSTKSRRNSDGTYNLAANLPGILKNLERLYSAGKLTEEQYLERFKMLQKVNSVTE